MTGEGRVREAASSANSERKAASEIRLLLVELLHHAALLEHAILDEKNGSHATVSDWLQHEISALKFIADLDDTHGSCVPLGSGWFILVQSGTLARIVSS